MCASEETGCERCEIARDDEHFMKRGWVTADRDVAKIELVREFDSGSVNNYDASNQKQNGRNSDPSHSQSDSDTRLKSQQSQKIE